MPRTNPRASLIAPAGPPEAQKYGGALFLRDIPKTTKNMFKTACAAKNVTMRDAHIIFMRRFSVAVQTGQNTIRIDRMKPSEASDQGEDIGT